MTVLHAFLYACGCGKALLREAWAFSGRFWQIKICSGSPPLLDWGFQSDNDGQDRGIGTAVYWNAQWMILIDD